MTVELASPTAMLLRAERRQSRLSSSLVAMVALTATPLLLLGPSAVAWHVCAVLAVLAVVLLVGLFIVAGDRRIAALRVIADGEEHLALPAVARVRAELLDPARRPQLATALRDWAATRPTWTTLHPAVRLPGCLRIDAGTAHELDELASLLARIHPRRAQPLACCELLLTDGARSPLHRPSDDGVRNVTARIAALLIEQQGA